MSRQCHHANGVALVAPSTVTGVDFSDHLSFWLQGYPAIMITDTAFFRTDTYHQETDTHEKLDYTAMAEIINGLENAVDAMANP